MADVRRDECKFLIPIVRDSSRKPHAPLAWQNFHQALFMAFAGSTSRKIMYVSLETAWGEYKYSNGSGRVQDENKEYLVALPKDQIESLRGILRRACVTFGQESIYLAVAGRVEFIRPSPNETGL